MAATGGRKSTTRLLDATRVVHLATLALVLVVAGSCGESREIKGESSPSWSPDGSQIAFALDNDIYVTNADDSGRTNLTDSADEEAEPTWSPDGDRIAFLSWGQRGSDIHVVNPDGTGQTNLTNIPALYVGLAWSPDGTKIAFATNRDLRRAGWAQVLETRSQESGPPLPMGLESWLELYVMNADGTGQTRLTFDGALNRNPTWSPDGTKIAFQSNRDGDHEIYVIGVDGTDLTQLTDNTHADALPAWSPDGRHIAFVSNRAKTEFLSDRSSDWDIYFMIPDGTEQFNLTNSTIVNFTSPSWSPDSRYLAFEGRYTNPVGGKGSNEIYAMRMEGLYGYSRLTDNRTNDRDLYLGPVVWSPNGNSIAFLSRRAGPSRVRVAEVTRNVAADGDEGSSPDSFFTHSPIQLRRTRQ